MIRISSKRVTFLVLFDSATSFRLYGSVPKATQNREATDFTQPFSSMKECRNKHRSFCAGLNFDGRFVLERIIRRRGMSNILIKMKIWDESFPVKERRGREERKNFTE